MQNISNPTKKSMIKYSEYITEPPPPPLPKSKYLHTQKNSYLLPQRQIISRVAQYSEIND